MRNERSYDASDSNSLGFFDITGVLRTSVISTVNKF